MKKEAVKYFEAIGRRKTATATVRLQAQAGDILVNGKEALEYFKGLVAEVSLLSPLKATSNLNKFSGTVKVSGGGITGQLEATRLAIARALVMFDAEHRGVLRLQGLMTRDPREKERKKYNLHKARRAHQFSKR